MSRTILAVTTLGLCAALAAPAWAGDAASGEPCAAPARVATIPAYTACQPREVAVPAVTRERCVPVYETVMVPVTDRVRTPVYETVEVPVYEMREVPVTRTVNEPVWQECEVPAYKQVCKQRQVKLWNPFGCEDFCVDLWKETDCVPCGTEKKMMIVGYQPREVACGTRLERVQTGTRTEQRQCGTKVECVTTGERPVQRLTGYRTEVEVVCPATTRTVVERVPVPCERVTVVPDEAVETAAPLPETSRVLGETEFVQAVARAR